MAEPSSKKRRMEVAPPLSVAMSGLARHQVTLPETLSPGGVHGCRVAVAVSLPLPHHALTRRLRHSRRAASSSP